METNHHTSDYFTNMNLEAVSGNPGYNVAVNPYEERLISLLQKSTKMSTLLIGPPGIGKTSLVKRLVNRINSGDVPEKLEGTNILQLDVTTLLAKTKFRGDFEKKILDMLSEYKSIEKGSEGGKPIIYVEELYTMIGAGSCEGQEALNLSNMIKPWLSNQELIIIGDTTITEFNNYLVSDPAFRRRFNELYMAAPDHEATMEILKLKAKQLARKNRIRIPAQILEKTITLSERSMQNRNQPDKSIDLLDEAVAIARKDKSKILTINHLSESLFVISGHKIFLDPGKEIIQAHQEIGSRLKKKIIGQDANIDQAVRKVLIKTTFNWAPSRGCLCGMLFSGPTGTGKTQLVKEVANEFNMHLLHLDLSEHNSMNKMLGAPPGFPGSGKGMLTEFLTTYQRGIIFFDEAEKIGDPQIMNMFLQMLDEGRISSNDGQVFSLASMIIIFATNAVTNPRQLGYNSSAESNPSELLNSAKIFPKEMLHRLDDILIFRQLDRSDLVNIFFRDLENFTSSMHEYNRMKIGYHRKGFLESFISEQIISGMNGRDMPRLINGLILDRIIDRIGADQRNHIMLNEDFFS